MTFVRYITIQLLAYGIDMGGFLLLSHRFSVGPLAANIGGKLAAGLFAFVAHRVITFDMTGAPMGRQAARYAAMLALNVPLSSGVLSGTLLVLPWPAAAKFAADVICVGISYSVSRLYVFAAPSSRGVR